MLRHIYELKMANNCQNTRAVKHFLRLEISQYTVRTTELILKRFDILWSD